MNGPDKPHTDRSVSIGGDAQGNIIQTGDHDTASLQYQQVQLPSPEEVDITAELAAIREMLSRLDTPDRNKIDNALGEAEDELTKEAPDRDEVGKALDRALDYAQKVKGFAEVIENLKPHVSAAAAWLGREWHKILTVVGLIV